MRRTNNALANFFKRKATTELFGISKNTGTQHKLMPTEPKKGKYSVNLSL